jgi:hypothetical protein
MQAHEPHFSVGLQRAKARKADDKCPIGFLGPRGWVALLSGVVAHPPGRQHFPRASQQGPHLREHTGHIGVRGVSGDGLVVSPAGCQHERTWVVGVREQVIVQAARFGSDRFDEFE